MKLMRNVILRNYGFIIAVLLFTTYSNNYVLAGNKKIKEFQSIQLIVRIHSDSNLSLKEIHEREIAILNKISYETNTKLNFIRNMSMGAIVVELQYNKDETSSKIILDIMNNDKDIEHAQLDHIMHITM